MTKTPVIGGSRGIVPKPTLPSKSSSGLTVPTRTKSVTSTSSGNNLSDNIGKFSFIYLKKRLYMSTLSCPAVRTPSRIAPRNKAEPEISSLSSLMSATKLSSSISPASSISDFSSESSSTISVAKRVCNSSRSSIDSCSSRKVLLDADADQGTHSHIPQNDPSLERQEDQHHSQKERTTPGVAVLPPAPKKPSGLRLPSPKIGFFDGVSFFFFSIFDSYNICWLVVSTILLEKFIDFISLGLWSHTILLFFQVQYVLLQIMIIYLPHSFCLLSITLHMLSWFHNAVQVKPLVRTPRGGTQPRTVVPGSLPKHGALSPNEGQNKTEIRKLHDSKSIVSIENTKSINQQAPHPNSFLESSDVAIKTSDGAQNKSCSNLPLGADENTSLIPVAEKVNHDLLPLKGVNNQANAHHDDQIDSLSKQVGHMDINFETREKFNRDSLSLFQTDISSQDDSNGLELSLARSPFAVKDSFCNMDDVVFTESTVSETKSTPNLPVLDSIIMKENN